MRYDFEYTKAELLRERFTQTYLDWCKGLYVKSRAQAYGRGFFPLESSLVLPKRILDGIIEMLYALDKIAPGTANDDTLLYGVEVKFYNMEVAVDENLESCCKGLYVIGDGSGITHSLSHASASGVYVARRLTGK